MKLTAVSASALLAMLVVTAAHAQPSGTTNEPHHAAGAAATSAAPEAAAPTDSSAGAAPMSPMCRQMMGDMMSMGMGSAAPPDSKGTADMLQMRGQMMKAMGDVMMKHARRMRGMSGQ